MKKLKWLLLLALCAGWMIPSFACTNVIVGKAPPFFLEEKTFDFCAGFVKFVK